MKIERGEIWIATLNPTQGSEQSGIRPVIIFQEIVFLNLQQLLLLFL